MQHDVFICHASEDKEDFVRPLAEQLRLQYIDVWYDEFSLSIGDSLTRKIDEGLAKSNFGIVVLSPNFFNKAWAQRELNGLTTREMVEGRDVILPIWHRVGVKEVMQYSPPLADKKAVSSALGINTILREITRKIRPDESPLIIAQNYLISLGLNPPPISDEWWLDMVEYKEFLKFPDLNMDKIWIFPLPSPNEDRGRDRGMNIASTALQLDWSFEAAELDISSITPPDQVHEFLRRWPGLMDCARENAGVLALYVPQITMPGFDQGLEDVFDELMKKGNSDAYRIFSYGSHDTVDDKDPLCGDVIAFRHPSFGNYLESDLGHWYFSAHDTSYTRSRWEIFEGLVWLLSPASSWVPRNIREMLIRGIKSRDRWASYTNDNADNPFINNLLIKKRNQFKLTKTTRSGLVRLTENALKALAVDCDPELIVKQIIDQDFISGYYNYREWLNEQRKR